MKRVISLLIIVLLLCSLFPISSLAVTHPRQYYTEDEIRALAPKYLKDGLQKEYGNKYDINKTKYAFTEVSNTSDEMNWWVRGRLELYRKDGTYATIGTFSFRITAMFDMKFADLYYFNLFKG